MRWEFILLTAILNLLVAILSGGLAVEAYKRRQKKKEDQETSNTVLQVERIKDSQYLAGKLLDQVDKLEKAERELIKESIELNKRINLLEREKEGLERLSIDQDEEIKLLNATIRTKDVELASLRSLLSER